MMHNMEEFLTQFSIVFTKILFFFFGNFDRNKEKHIEKRDKKL